MLQRMTQRFTAHAGGMQIALSQKYTISTGPYATHIIAQGPAATFISSRIIRRTSTVDRERINMGEKVKGEGKKRIVAVLPPGDDSNSPEVLNSVNKGLGLREWLEGMGHEYIVTGDKDKGTELDKLLPTTDICITTPFWPAYLDKERLEKAKKLELSLTAGVGSDHIDLHAAAKKGITVAEVTGSNVESVAESEVMRILILMRNFIEGYKQAVDGEWDIPRLTKDAYDLKGKTVGTVAAGRIGCHVIKRLKEWGVTMLYYGRHQKKNADELGAKFEPDFDKFLAQCDVITINCPLTDKTRHMFNKETIGKMKKGSFLVNNARGAICDPPAVVEALKSGQLRGYSGDVWPEQPAPPNHPWRKMPRHAMTPHYSGDTIDAQHRIAAGVKQMLQLWFDHKPFPEDFYIVREGKLAEQYT